MFDISKAAASRSLELRGKSLKEVPAALVDVAPVLHALDLAHNQLQATLLMPPFRPFLSEKEKIKRP